MNNCRCCKARSSRPHSLANLYANKQFKHAENLCSSCCSVHRLLDARRPVCSVLPPETMLNKELDFSAVHCYACMCLKARILNEYCAHQFNSFSYPCSCADVCVPQSSRGARSCIQHGQYDLGRPADRGESKLRATVLKTHAVLRASVSDTHFFCFTLSLATSGRSRPTAVMETGLSPILRAFQFAPLARYTVCPNDILITFDGPISFLSHDLSMRNWAICFHVVGYLLPPTRP
jgi:hypothetical protein